MDAVGRFVGTSDFALEDLGALEIWMLRMLEPLTLQFSKIYGFVFEKLGKFACVRCQDCREVSTFQIEAVKCAIARDAIQLT